MNYFLVFQNKSYKEEYKGGYMWAPQQNHTGQTFHHWTDMQNIKKGDIIFSSFGGQMLSVLIAKEDCVEHERPVDLDGLELWQKEGFLVDAKYVNLNVPITYKDYMDTILVLQGQKYAPFNKAGRGNTGYVFRVTTELANFLFGLIEKTNGYTKDKFLTNNKLDKQMVQKIRSGLDQPIILDKTEKELIIKARIGQTIFKKSLLDLEPKCKLCGVIDTRFLIASHIKPWSQSNNQEKLDGNNGLLLCPNHDALFDKGYISFDENGNIKISPQLDEGTKVFMNINDSITIKSNHLQREYLKWHRKHKFKDSNDFTNI